MKNIIVVVYLNNLVEDIKIKFHRKADVSSVTLPSEFAATKLGISFLVFVMFTADFTPFHYASCLNMYSQMLLSIY